MLISAKEPLPAFERYFRTSAKNSPTHERERVSGGVFKTVNSSKIIIQDLLQSSPAEGPDSGEQQQILIGQSEYEKTTFWNPEVRL